MSNNYYSVFYVFRTFQFEPIEIVHKRSYVPTGSMIGSMIDRVVILNDYYLEKKHVLLKGLFTVHCVRIMYMIVITQTDIHSAALYYILNI